MVTLAVLGSSVCRRFGQSGFLIIYLLSVAGGAATFALVGSTVQPVVGASGALFGLAGALVHQDLVLRRRRAERLWPVLYTIVLLVMLKGVMWVLLDGLLAEAHLGGFAAGWGASAGTRRLGG